MKMFPYCFSFLNGIIRVRLQNERGSALMLVLSLFLLVSLLFSAALAALLEHRQILLMRLEQRQAYELVQNGISWLKNENLRGEETLQPEYRIAYAAGEVRIEVCSCTRDEIKAVVTGFTEAKAVQMYEVAIDRASNRLTHFKKQGGRERPCEISF